MSFVEPIVVVALCVFCSALFSGSETGMYSLSPTRVELEASEGRRSARLIRRLLRRDTSILITILIGNNLVLEIATLRLEHLLEALGVADAGRELVLTLILTPVVFLFGELLPKDLFRRRPHTLMGYVAPFLGVSRVLFWPLERVLRLLTAALERLAGLPPERLSRGIGRREVMMLLEEGARTGALEPRAERLARNALALRRIPIARAMLPWSQVERLDEGRSPEELRAAVERSSHTRLPTVTPAGAVTGYVHQLDVLADPPGEGRPDVLARRRTILVLPPDTSVDRALARLRTAGQRVAVVGSADEPLGLLTLKDLLEEISGDLGSW